MKVHVLDASVVAAAFFQEEHAARAAGLLTGDALLRAPDLIHAELANVIWKRHRRGEISADEAGQLLSDFRSLPLETIPCGDLAELALELALRTERTVYDCLYLALAVTIKSKVVTADKRFAGALAKTALAKHVTWLGDVK